MADHVGIYAISGAFMPNPATRVASTTTPTGILAGRSSEATSNAAGSVIVNASIPAPAVLAQLDNEVVSLNAMRSGTLVIESSSAGVVVEIPTYFSKATRLDHQIVRRPIVLKDLYDNVPPAAPSASVSGGQPFFSRSIGYLSGGTVISVGSALPGPVQVVLYSQYVPDRAAIVSAALGNIIYAVSGVYTAAIAVYTATFATDPSGVVFYPAFADARGPVSGGDWGSASISLHSWVPMSSSVSGVYLNDTFFDPSFIDIPVTASGRIRDIRAWVELIHDYRSVGQFTNYGSPGYAWGLQALQLALRSPNTNFRAAHPIWNAPGAEALPIRADTTLTGTNNRFGNEYLGVPELLKNSYLLWAGHSVDEGPGDVLGVTQPNYHEFDFDIDMRTVFWDGSNFRNPRDLTSLHPSPSVTRSWIDMQLLAVSGADYQSPSAFIFQQTNPTASVVVPVTLTGVITGSDVPWFVDSRLDTGNIVKSGAFYTRASQSVPPDGWLSTTDASVKGWQSTFISSPISRSFKSGRMVVRQTTNQVYMMGGEGINGDSDTSCSNYVASVPFFIDRSIEQVTLLSGTILQNSSMPVYRSKMGLAYYTSSAGEHVIMVGGKSSTLDVTGTNDVYVGDFVGQDVVWEQHVSSANAPDPTVHYQLPASFPHYDCFVHVIGGYAHMIGGYSSGAFNPNVWSIKIDPLTGRPTGSWTITGASSTLMPINSAVPVPDPTPNGVDFLFIVGYSGSSDIAQIAHLSGAFQLAFTINTGFPAPTGTYRYPLGVDGQHVIAAFNNVSPITSTFVTELWNDGSPFIIQSEEFPAWHHTASAVPATSIAASGTSLTYGNIIFVGCGSPTGSFEPQLFATTIIVAAADDGEFPTKGLQIGPNSMKPVYPLLDDVYSFKVFDQPPSLVSPNHGAIRGFRPGLRGTEVSGTWNLLLGGAAEVFSAVSGAEIEHSVGVWLRQVRLEFVIDHNVGLSDFYPSRTRKWLRPSLVPGQDGYQAIGIVSGAGAWDTGLNQTQVFQSPDYGRSVGITDATASSPASFAVQTFITGALFDHLSSSGLTYFTWFLGGNGFGTPYIPDSSMSLGVTGTAEDIDASASQDLYRRTVGQTTLVPNANTMVDYLRRVNYSQTTQQVAESASIPTTGSYFGF